MRQVNGMKIITNLNVVGDALRFVTQVIVMESGYPSTDDFTRHLNTMPIYDDIETCHPATTTTSITITTITTTITTSY